MMDQYYNKRLAEKNRQERPEAFEHMRSGYIENELRSQRDPNGVPLYPTENTEIAILRKQVAILLDVLRANGITADHQEFTDWNRAAEEAKKQVKEMML